MEGRHESAVGRPLPRDVHGLEVASGGLTID
jgi:hypothetical protein